MRPNFVARPASNTSDFLSCVSLPCGPFGAPLSASAPPVRGVLRLLTGTRNPFFREKCIFCDKPDFSHVLGGLGQFQYVDAGSDRNFLRQNRNRIYQIWGYPQSLPQDSPLSGQTHCPILAGIGPIHTLLTFHPATRRDESPRFTHRKCKKALHFACRAPD